tara:strand:- start:12146 stop:12484 length:339 start_codon:yes stop_codon:yes gene_type:complete
MARTRHERLLGNTRGYKPLIGVGEPRESEGSQGEIRINMTSSGLKLFVKFNNQWFSTNLSPVSKKIDRLINSTGGTVSDSLADVPASYNEATLANQLASLTAKINEILDRIG